MQLAFQSGAGYKSKTYTYAVKPVINSAAGMMGTPFWSLSGCTSYTASNCAKSVMRLEFASAIPGQRLRPNPKMISRESLVASVVKNLSGENLLGFLYSDSSCVMALCKEDPIYQVLTQEVKVKYEP